jgi:hypothetical protein
MRTAILFLLLLILLPIFVAVQDLLPEIPPERERALLLPLLFCFAVLALPLVPALYFALITAVAQGLIFQSEQTGFGLVLPVVFFLSWAILLQMASEAAHGMRWELHALGSALVTMSLLGGEFLLICFNRGGFPVDTVVLLRIAVPSAVAFLSAPFLYFLLVSLVPLAPEEMPGAIRKPGLDS